MPCAAALSAASATRFPIGPMEYGDVASIAYKLSLSYRDGHEVDVAPGDAFPRAARIPYNNRALHGITCRRVQQVAQLQFVERGRDDQVGYRAECGHVEYTVVGGSVLADQSCPVKAQDHFQSLEGNVVYDAVVCPLHEG